LRRGTPKQKAQVIWELRHEFKVSLLQDVAKLPRSTYYYYTKRRQEPDKYCGIKEQITNIFHENRGRYGYRRITMGRKGNCLDNAVTENFFGLLKSELLCLQEFDSMDHFKAELVASLDSCNNRRIKAKRKGVPPALHRKQALLTA